MHREGHVGAAALTYTPLGVAAVAVDAAGLALLGAVVTVSLASLPDSDFRIPFVSHRGITHTVWFAVAVGGVLAAAGWVAADAFGPPPLVAGFGFAVGWLVVVSHVGADALTPMGVTPFTPVSGRHYTVDLVRADNTLANYLLLAVGVGVAVLAATLVVL